MPRTEIRARLLSQLQYEGVVTQGATYYLETPSTDGRRPTGEFILALRTGEAHSVLFCMENGESRQLRHAELDYLWPVEAWLPYMDACTDRRGGL